MKKIFENIGRNDIRNVIAVIAVIGCFILLYLMQMKPIPAENKETVNIATGFIFGGLLAGITGYYFGSSKQDVENKKEE